MRKKSLFAICVFAVMLPSLAPAQQVHAPQKVARIEYGEADSQILVSWAETRDEPYALGVEGLAVDNQGNIYVGASLTGKVKKFSPSGGLLAITERALSNMQCFLVDQRGNIIVHNEHSGSWLTKFDSHGKLVWSRSSGGVIPRRDREAVEQRLNMRIGDFFGGWVTDGPGDTVIVDMDAEEIGTIKPPKRIGLQLDKDGILAKVLPAFGLAGDGYWMWYESSSTLKEGPPEWINVLVYGADGELKKRIPLDVQAKHYEGVQTGLSTVWPDRRGGFVTICHVSSANPVELAPGVGIRTDVVLNRYDRRGRFVEQFRFPGNPFSGRIGSHYAFAPNGKLYYLRFDKTGMDVMAVNPSQGPRDAAPKPAPPAR